MKNRGFSLAELLISLFLASLIMTILLQIYFLTKQEYNATQQLLNKHFDLLWVSSLLSFSIRQSGFTPCIGIEHLTTPEAIPTLSYSNQKQSITTHRMTEHYVSQLKILSPARILVPTTSTLNERRPLLIADCFHAEVHTIQQIDQLNSGKLITLVKPLAYTYSSSSYAGEWIEETWFVKNNARGKPALYYHNVQTEELTTLIQGLHTSKQLLNSKSLFEVSLKTEDNRPHTFYIAVPNS